MKKTTTKEKKGEEKKEGSKKEEEEKKQHQKKVKEKKVEKKEDKPKEDKSKEDKSKELKKDEKPKEDKPSKKTTEKEEEKSKKTTSTPKKTGTTKKHTSGVKKTTTEDPGDKRKSQSHDSTTTTKTKGEEGLSPTRIMKSEYNKWKKSGHDCVDIKWVKANAEDCQIVLSFESGDTFSVTYPETYPDCKDESFFVFGDTMDAWSDAMVEYTDKKLSFSDLLTKCALTYQELGGSAAGGGTIEFDDEYGGVDIDEDFGFKEEKSEKKLYDPVEVEFSNKKFLEIGSPAASLRLIKDLKNIKRADPKILGFSAEPRFEPGKNLENLYHWIVKLKFEGDLGRDLLESQKKFGIDYVELEMRFSESYPFQPPFVRVVRPRFKFHTGHVTLGGSICMELLTNSGWRSTNDIESILIQIRAEMQGGNARLDLSNSAQYSEAEAWDAFYRAAKTHSWDIKNIGPNMFPNIK